MSNYILLECAGLVKGIPTCYIYFNAIRLGVLTPNAFYPATTSTGHQVNPNTLTGMDSKEFEAILLGNSGELNPFGSVYNSCLIETTTGTTYIKGILTPSAQDLTGDYSPFFDYYLKCATPADTGDQYITLLEQLAFDTTLSKDDRAILLNKATKLRPTL